jgi:hypothetical protein
MKQKKPPAPASSSKSRASSQPSSSAKFPKRSSSTHQGNAHRQQTPPVFSFPVWNTLKQANHAIYAAVAGVGLWFVFFFPFIRAGILHLPLDSPVARSPEVVSLSTYGKWFWNTPHRFLTDAFSGDFPVFYNYICDYVNNAVAFVAGIPPLVVQLVWIGPLLGLVIVLVNYHAILAVSRSQTIALYASILIAYIGPFLLFASSLDPNNELRPLMLGVFDVLALNTGGTWGWILLIPALCLMYLAYTEQAIKYKVFYGIVFGLCLHLHTLTFIALFLLNLFYLTFSTVERLCHRFPQRRNIILTVAILLPLLYIGWIIANNNPLVPATTLVAAALLLYGLCFVIDTNKKFYLISYPVSLAVALPYLVMMQRWFISSAPAGTGAEYPTIKLGYDNRIVPLLELVVFYMPHLIGTAAGLVGLRKSSSTSEHTSLFLWLLSLFVGLLLLSYNSVLGWTNHPYRFVPMLVMVMMLLSVYGIRFLYRSSSVGKVAAVALSFWLAGIAGANVARVLSGKENDFTKITPLPETAYAYLTTLRTSTSSDRYLLCPPELSYPSGAYAAALMLNFSQSRGFIPDYRYLLDKERYANRARLFGFFFPNYPAYDEYTGFQACIYADEFHLRSDSLLGALTIQDARIKNTIFNIYGIGAIGHVISEGAQCIYERYQRYDWKVLHLSPVGILVQPPSVQQLSNQQGIAIFERGVFRPEAFRTSFTVSSSGTYLLVASGFRLQRHAHTILLDGKPLAPQHHDNSLILAECELSAGNHSLIFEEATSDEHLATSDYLLFMNVIHRDFVPRYLTRSPEFYTTIAALQPANSSRQQNQEQTATQDSLKNRSANSSVRQP